MPANSVRSSPSCRQGLETPIPLPSRKSSMSRSNNDNCNFSTISFQPDLSNRKAKLSGLATDIGLFLQTLDDVTSIRVASQQKRKALIRFRENVALRDEALASAIRKSRAEGVVLDQDNFLALSDASIQARNELGPLEDSFEITEFQLVPREDDLTEQGEELKQQLEDLVSSVHEKLVIGRPSRQPSIRSVDQQHPGLVHPDQSAQLGVRKAQEPSDPDHRPPHPKFMPFVTTKSHQTNIGSTQSEPLLRQYAPDLFPDKSWESWTQPIEYLNDDPLPRLVIEDDLLRFDAKEIDIPIEDNRVLLGNRTTVRCPFFKNDAAVEYLPHAQRISLWLLCTLRRSRLEVLRLREVIDQETKEWTWADILEFWNTDDAATSRTPPESLNVYNTVVAENTWGSPRSPRYPDSEPSFGTPLAIRLQQIHGDVRIQTINNATAQPATQKLPSNRL